MTATAAVRHHRDEQSDTMLFGPPPGHGQATWMLVGIITVILMVLHAWQFGIGAGALAANALLLMASGAVMLPRVAPGDGRLPLGWAWGAALATALAQIVTVWDATGDRDQSYAPWYLRTATIICVVLILRHRSRAGWAGALLAYAAVAGIGIMDGEAFGQWAVHILRQLAVMVAIQVFAILLNRNARAIALLRQAEHARLTAVHFREAAMRQRLVEACRIRGLVTRTLERIAEGEQSAELRNDATLLEGALRDTLRGRRLTTGPVPTAARRARARGVDVVLLDDLGEDESRARMHLPDAALEWIAEHLDAAVPPRATARLAADAEGCLTLSFYAEGAGLAPEFLKLGSPDPS